MHYVLCVVKNELDTSSISPCLSYSGAETFVFSKKYLKVKSTIIQKCTLENGTGFLLVHFPGLMFVYLKKMERIGYEAYIGEIDI